MANYKELDAWKISMQLVKEVYLLTKKFPKEGFLNGFSNYNQKTDLK